MIRALLTHIWLLLTLRHDGQGLPKKSIALLSMIIAISAMMSVIASQSLGIGIFHGGMLLMIAAFVSPVVASSLALISIGMDGIDFLAQLISGQRIGGWGWDVVEIFVWFVFVARYKRRLEDLKGNK